MAIAVPQVIEGTRRLRGFVGKLLGRPRREDILRLLPRDSVGAEVGVFKGEFTRHLLSGVRPRELHLIDAYWLLYGERYPDWGAYTDSGRLTTKEAYAMALAVVVKYDRRRVTTFHVADDMECLATFPGAYFDWVYLDTTHEYEHSRLELELLRRKIRSGGMIAGDDWCTDPTHPHHGLCRAVMQFCATYDWVLMRVDSLGQWCIRERVVDTGP
jgi:hypothetical protein